MRWGGGALLSLFLINSSLGAVCIASRKSPLTPPPPPPVGPGVFVEPVKTLMEC